MPFSWKRVFFTLTKEQNKDEQATTGRIAATLGGIAFLIYAVAQYLYGILPRYSSEQSPLGFFLLYGYPFVVMLVGIRFFFIVFSNTKTQVPQLEIALAQNSIASGPRVKQWGTLFVILYLVALVVLAFVLFSEQPSGKDYFLFTILSGAILIALKLLSRFLWKYYIGIIPTEHNIFEKNLGSKVFIWVVVVPFLLLLFFIWLDSQVHFF